MASYIYAYDIGQGLISIANRGNGEKATVRATRVQKGPWRANNRRTDYWFTWEGLHYHGHCSESTTCFKARTIKQ